MDIFELPSLEKTTLSKVENKLVSSCCTQPKDETACCTPSKTEEENGGACCQQPTDGSACCSK